MADRSERGRKAGGLPFVGNMTDGIDFVRKMWGVTGLPQLPTAAGITQFAQGLPQALPSMITPTLDVSELDKRIADLRAVEQWLALNANMLRATIQSLEVQRNTIATLKSFGGSVLSTVTRGNHGEMPVPDPEGYVREAQARTAARHRAAQAAAAEQAAAEQAALLAAQISAPAPAAPTGAALPARKRGGAHKKLSPLATAGAMPLSPAAWWGALQDQFTRVAAAAAAEAARVDASDKRAGGGAAVRSDRAKAPARKPRKAAARPRGS
ncbi:MAG: hypothetical protein MUC68_14575 [Burkholderiaceae bacterium]|jgi:hypothetical protein|nr:hypothetical protein [Burkholderiaceae bacterium]